MRRRQFFDKNIEDNFSAGVIYVNENEKITDLNDGLDFVTFLENFKLLQNNKHFSINKNELIVLKCKLNQLVNLNWEIITTSNEKISLAFRILQNKKIIDSTRVNGYSDLAEIQNFGTTLVQINSKDSFSIQIKNIDVKNPSEKIIIKTVKLILEN